MDDQAGAGAPKIALLRDTAAETDFFGSHERIAEAVTQILLSGDDAKTVGILGPWGSGKSTIVEFVAKRLAASDSPKFHVFPYDAWLHQSDPPKRAFLDRFVDFLERCDLARRDQWKTILDRLNRRVEDTSTTTTPYLTFAGRVLLLSLVPVPFGLRLIAPDWYKSFDTGKLCEPAAWVFPLGILLSALPIIAAVMLWWTWRPERRPWHLRAFWTKANLLQHRKPHEKDSILALVVNKHVQKVTSQTIRDPEPTTIEFQSAFREMLAAATAKGDRIVIVIDNLDRLPEHEAVEMWTTIRGFFLGALPSSDQLSAARLPSVLLPIDMTAIGRIYGAGDDGEALAQSFIDKTFDITVHVTGPVLSDWNDYLTRQLEHALGADLANQWAFQVGRIYGMFAQTRRITPRDINRMVNDIAILWFQWHALGIPFPSVAYYAIYRRAFESNFPLMINSPAIDLSLEDPDWQCSLGAMHFGVKPADALQIIIEPQLREAVQNEDAASFKKLADAKGFDRAFDKFIDDRQLVLPITAKVAKLLDGIEGDKPWTVRSWRKLRRIYLSGSIVEGIEDRAGVVLEVMSRRCPGAERAAFLSAVADRISELPQASLANPEQFAAFATVIDTAQRAMLRDNSPLPPITIRDGNAYLDIGARLVRRENIPLPVRSDTSTEQLIALYLRDAAQTQLPALWSEKIDLLLSLKAPDDWNTLIDFMGEDIAQREAGFSQMDAAIELLGRLRSEVPYAAQRLDQLRDSNMLQARFNEAIGANLLETGASLAALLIVTESPIGYANGQPWDEFLNKSAGFAADVERKLLAFSGGTYFDLLAKQVTADPIVRPLMMAIAVRRLDAGVLGSLYIKQIIDDPLPYLTLLPTGRRDDFLYKLPVYNDFWKLLEKAELKGGSMQIYPALIAASNPLSDKRRDARKMLSDQLKKVSDSEWVAAVSNDSSLLRLARELREADKRLVTLGAPLFDALTRLLPAMLASEERPYIGAWFASTGLLSAAGRRTLLKNVRDQINGLSELPNLLGLLEAGGEMLLNEAEFAQHADDSVRHILIPLIGSDDGVGWLLKQRDCLGSWMQRSSSSTRDFVNERMRERLTSASTEVRARLDTIAKTWSLALIET